MRFSSRRYDYILGVSERRLIASNRSILWFIDRLIFIAALSVFSIPCFMVREIVPFLVGGIFAVTAFFMAIDLIRTIFRKAEVCVLDFMMGSIYIQTMTPYGRRIVFEDTFSHIKGIEAVYKLYRDPLPERRSERLYKPLYEFRIVLDSTTITLNVDSGSLFNRLQSFIRGKTGVEISRELDIPYHEKRNPSFNIAVEILNSAYNGDLKDTPVRGSIMGFLVISIPALIGTMMIISGAHERNSEFLIMVTAWGLIFLSGLLLLRFIAGVVILTKIRRGLQQT